MRKGANTCYALLTHHVVSIDALEALVLAALFAELALAAWRAFAQLQSVAWNAFLACRLSIAINRALSALLNFVDFVATCAISLRIQSKPRLAQVAPIRPNGVAVQTVLIFARDADSVLNHLVVLAHSSIQQAHRYNQSQNV